MYNEIKYNFKDYREEKPQVEGWYIWRMNHKFIEGVILIFLAKFRERGAGFERVMSPEFDYWDGYRIHLPKCKIEWAEYKGPAPKPGNELLHVCGTNNAVCPFCKNKPNWGYSGRFIGSGPTDTDYYYLECCGWFNGFGMRMQNPLELSIKRNSAIMGDI